jgi:signal transduction histidine kinase
MANAVVGIGWDREGAVTAYLHGGALAVWLGHLRGAARAVPPRSGSRPRDPASSPYLTAGQTGISSLSEGPRHRRRLYGRLAAVFFTGAALLGLVTLPLPTPGLNVPATAVLSAAALVLGIAVWLAPWDSWPRLASLALVLPAFALIALANTYGGASLQTYGVFFLVVFVWIGIAHAPRTSFAVAPLAIAAYVLPLVALRENARVGLYSTVLTIGICVLVGEGMAWSVGRLEQIELALQRERDRTEHLRELDEMKDKFLSAVSHELRTPITICRGHLDVLEAAAGKPELQAVKETLVDELARMGRLVDDLATLARADDPTQLRMESLRLDSFMSSIAKKAEPILGRRLQVTSDVGSATLRADPQRLTQALLNLLQNAAEHARGDGPVQFTVGAEPASWRFEVADEGGGLPPGDEDSVFEPFSTGSSPTGGTGLGLAIARGIARAHGGECDVVNRPGRGAAFWVRIPR